MENGGFFTPEFDERCDKEVKMIFNDAEERRRLDELRKRLTQHQMYLQSEANLFGQYLGIYPVQQYRRRIYPFKQQYVPKPQNTEAFKWF